MTHSRTLEAAALLLTALAFLAAAAIAEARPEPPVVAELRPSTATAWAGEVFDVDLSLALTGGRRAEIVGSPVWPQQGFVAEPFAGAEQIELRGRPAVRQTARAMAPEAGTIELPAARQDLRVESGRARVDPFARLRQGMLADFDSFFDDSFFDSFFERTSLEQTAVASNAAVVEVRPLPAPVPDDFSGAVGRFTLVSSLVPEEVRAGEPVTWTLTLTGTGNWPAGFTLPARAVPADFRALQPKQQRRFEEGSLFTGAVSEDIVLIPNAAGTWELEPVRFTYFDPDGATYRTAVVEPPAIRVGAAAPGAAAAAAAAAGSNTALGEGQGPTDRPHGSSSSQSLASATSPETPPSPVDARPLREPRAGVGVALSPLPWRSFALLLAAPFGLLAAYGIALLAHRAWTAEPRRRRREALAALAEAVAVVRRSTDTDERREALLAWQHAVALLLDLDLAAPTPTVLRSCGRVDPEMIALWAECDTALYAADLTLPDDWCGRASGARRRLRRRRRPLAGNLTPGPALPAVAAALLLAIAVPARGEPLDDYTRGDFAAAGAAFEAAANDRPTDWIARYNLGALAARGGNPERALAETAAAFVLRPSDAGVRTNLAILATQVPGADPTVARFARGERGVALAGLLSPAMWQIVVVAAAATLALGGGILLRRGRPTPAAAGLVAAGAFAALVGWACLHQYGPLAEPAAALVTQATALRALPTEAADAASRTLEPGTLVLAGGGEFLGWSQVVLAGGEIGWLRHEAVAPLHGRRPS